MNFSKTAKFSRLLSLILVLVMMTTLFAGCKKDNTPEDTEGSLNLDLSGTSAPTETQTEPTETTAPVINENTATVINQINIRSSPSTEASVVGTLYAGDRVEVSRREVVTGMDWAYIISPTAGWIVMDHVEMDIPTEEDPNDTSTPAGETKPEEEDNDKDSESTNIKGVVNANGLRIRSEASTNGKVQGSYNKGDVITILETKNGWGRTNKGWVKLDYVNTTGSTTNNNDNDKDKDDDADVTITGNGSTTVQFRGIVTASELIVRASASQTATRLGSLKYGARVEFLEKSGTWGRTKDGWISLNYVYQDGTTGTKTGSGTVTGTQLHIRSGPGTGYTSVGSYNQGDRVTILERFTYNNVTWGCTNKGWISLQYVDMDGETDDNNSGTVDTNDVVTGSVNANGLHIRSGPGTSYGIVGTLNSGDRVTITSTTVAENITWGKITTGWIAMTYVDVDSE